MSTSAAGTPGPAQPVESKKTRDRTHWLYVGVVVAVVAGVLVGWLAPDAGKRSACSARCSWT